MAVIEALLYAVPRHLKEGKIVKLGQLGTFYLRVRGQGVDDPADFDVYKVRSSRIHFHPGKILRRMLKTIQYERR